jgi:hypothetical protein
MQTPYSCDFNAPDGTKINVQVLPDDAAIMLLSKLHWEQ